MRKDLSDNGIECDGFAQCKAVQTMRKGKKALQGEIHQLHGIQRDVANKRSVVIAEITDGGNSDMRREYKNGSVVSITGLRR
jgi:hypothetical protein